MKTGEKYILFLNNRYNRKADAFYLNLLSGKTTVAVDGGIRFFIKNRIYPNLLIGDFDSVPPMSERFLSHFDVIRYPSRKDKTDIHLAVDHVLRSGANEIDICGGIGGCEIDHILGNICLLDLVNKYGGSYKKKIRARLIDPGTEVYLVENGSVEITGEKGDYLSVIPLESGIKVKYRGLEYPPPSGRLKFGDSLTLRNRLTAKKCHLAISGRALVIRSANQS
nr:thiamine diphosphokinase [candidate division Zixibacteria bacterium]